MTWAVEVYATHKKVRIIRQLLSRDKEEVMAENNVRKKKKRKNDSGRIRTYASRGEVISSHTP